MGYGNQAPKGGWSRRPSLFRFGEGSTPGVVMPDVGAPPGSRTASRGKGQLRNWGGPIGSTGLVTGGGRRQDAVRVAVRAEIGSRTGS